MRKELNMRSTKSHYVKLSNPNVFLLYTKKKNAYIIYNKLEEK